MPYNYDSGDEAFSAMQEAQATEQGEGVEGVDNEQFEQDTLKQVADANEESASSPVVVQEINDLSQEILSELGVAPDTEVNTLHEHTVETSTAKLIEELDKFNWNTDGREILDVLSKFQGRIPTDVLKKYAEMDIKNGFPTHDGGTPKMEIILNLLSRVDSDESVGLMRHIVQSGFGYDNVFYYLRRLNCTSAEIFREELRAKFRQEHLDWGAEYADKVFDSE